MAKTTKSTQRMVSRHVKRHRREGMPPKQAIAAALSEARREGRKVPPRPRSGRTRKRAPAKRAARKGGRAAARKGRG